MVTSTPVLSPGRRVTRSGATDTFGIPFIRADSRSSTLVHGVGAVVVGPPRVVGEVVVYPNHELRSRLADPYGRHLEAEREGALEHPAGQGARRGSPVAEARRARSPQMQRRVRGAVLGDRGLGDVLRVRVDVVPGADEPGEPRVVPERAETA